MVLGVLLLKYFVLFWHFWYFEYFYSNTLYFFGISGTSGTLSTFTQILCTFLVFLVVGVLLLEYFVLLRYFCYLEYFYSNILYSFGISGIWSTFTFLLFSGSSARVSSEPTQFLQELLF